MSEKLEYTFDLRTPYTELERQVRERFLRLLIWVSLAITLSLMPSYGYIAFSSNAWQGWLVLGLQGIALILIWLAYRAMKQGYLDQAGYLLFPYLLLLSGLNALFSGVPDVIAPAYLAVIVTAGIIQSPTGNLVNGAVAMILWAVAMLIDQMGILPPTPFPAFVGLSLRFGLTALCFIFVGFLGYQASQRLQRMLTNANYQLVQANRHLEEANRLKSQFTARTSHELRTPLNAILVSADLMNRKVYGPLTDMQVDALDRVLRHTKRLQHLIDDILDLSKIEAGRLELIEKPFVLRDLVETARSTVEAKAKTKGLPLTVSVAPEMPERLIGDETRLTQIMVNLADNAIKFTERGEVRVEVTRFSADRWRITVTDTGRGIHEKDFDSIFEEFRRTDTAGVVAGTGLGLAITKQLVTLMGGEIRLESQIAKGTTFIVTLPLKETESAAKTPTLIIPASGG